MPPREMTEEEKQFIAEAEAGGFLVGYDAETGSPYAMGAPSTDNLRQAIMNHVCARLKCASSFFVKCTA